jgi:hypothetical protein
LVEEFEAAATILLSAVKRQIGTAQQFSGINWLKGLSRAVRYQHNSDARPDIDFAMIRFNGIGYRSNKPSCELFNKSMIATITHDNSEFVAAKATQKMIGTENATE